MTCLVTELSSIYHLRQLFLWEFFGHCSGSRTKTGLVSEVSKSMGYVDVPGVSVFYSVQPLKGQVGLEEIDALITSTPKLISSISSAIWARFISTKHATSMRI